MSELTLALLRARTAALLMDLSGAIWNETALDEAALQALEEYSRAIPRTAEALVNLPAAGSEVALEGVADLEEVLALHWPYDPALPDDRQPPNRVRSWALWWDDGRPLAVLRAEGSPQAGETLRLWYAGRHTLAGLAGAAATSLHARHEGLLVRGVAGFAALMRAVDRVELRAYGGQRNEPLLLQEWGRFQVEAFRQELKAERRRELPAADRPAWTLDRWD